VRLRQTAMTVSRQRCVPNAAGRGNPRVDDQSLPAAPFSVPRAHVPNAGSGRTMYAENVMPGATWSLRFPPCERHPGRFPPSATSGDMDPDPRRHSSSDDEDPSHCISILEGETFAPTIVLAREIKTGFQCSRYLTRYLIIDSTFDQTNPCSRCVCLRLLASASGCLCPVPCLWRWLSPRKGTHATPTRLQPSF